MQQEVDARMQGYNAMRTRCWTYSYCNTPMPTFTESEKSAENWQVDRIQPKFEPVAAVFLVDVSVGSNRA
jgi:hypothetical protein